MPTTIIDRPVALNEATTTQRTTKQLTTAQHTTAARWEARRDRVTSLAKGRAARSSRESRRVRDTIVVEYLDLAEAMARRYATRGHDADDLCQVAYLGLIKASERFDPDKGEDFVKFAVPTISGEIKRHLRDNGWVIRPPRRIQELRSRATKRVPQLAQELGKMPSDSDLARALGEDVRDVEEALGAGDAIRPASLDAPIAGDDTMPLGETLGDDGRDFERAELIAAIAPAFADLDARDRRILYLRFFKEQTQQEIAGELGVTQMQVSRLLTKLLARLRESLHEVRIAS